jgi:O-antigen polymerase
MITGRRRQSILFSFLICLVFILSPFYSQQSPGGEGLAIPYNSWVWISALAVIAAGIFQILLKKILVLPKYWLAIAALPLGLMMSGFIVDSSKPTQWLFRIGYVLGGFLFFVALFQLELKRRQIENIFYALCGAATLHSLIAFCQVMGWYFTTFIPQTSANHPISIFQQINVHASYLTTSFFIALFLASSPSIKQRSAIYMWLLIITIFSTTAMLLSISSRTTLVAFSLSLPLILATRFNGFKRYTKLSLALCLAFLLGITAGANLSKGFAKYETRLDTQRSHARTFIYDLSWQIIKQKPLLGHGLGSFEKVFQEAKITYPNSHQMGSLRFSHPHNEMLFWMIESGIVSLVGIAIAMLFTLLTLFKIGWRRGLSYFALLFPISFHTQVELPFYLSSALWFLWLTILYLIHSHHKIRYKSEISVMLNRFITVNTLILTSIVIGFMLHTMLSLSGITHFMYARKPNLSLLDMAQSNVYFQSYGQNIKMSTLLFYAIGSGTQQFASQFILWAEQHVIDNPSTSTINDLALAYYYTGDRQKAISLMNRAIKMYPTTAPLKQRQKEILEGKHIKDFKQKIRTHEVQSSGQATP